MASKEVVVLVNRSKT